MKQIFRSLAITVMFGGLVGFAISYTFDLSLLRTIVGTVLAQFIFFMLYNNWIARRTEALLEVEMTARIKEYTKQGVDLECAYCKTLNYVPIRMDVDNDFNCIDCNKVNAVYLSLTTAQKTQSINMLPLSVNTLIADELEAKESIANG